MGRSILVALIVSLFGVSSSELLSSKAFPARGFAKILSTEEAQEKLNRYRSLVAAESNASVYHQAYSFRFRLRHMPRRGEETIRKGCLSGPFIGHGVSRLRLYAEGNATDQVYLFRNGPVPQAWRVDKVGETTMELTPKDWFVPLIEGMNQTPFDLLMPFVFWKGKYEKSGKVAGRPAHVFHFPYPEWAKNINPKLSHIAMGIDDTYDAPLRVENYAAGYIPQSEYILQSFKKLQDRWIVKAIDFKDGKTRSNTRFEITEAAVDLDLDASLFSPSGLLRLLPVAGEMYQSL